MTVCGLLCLLLGLGRLAPAPTTASPPRTLVASTTTPAALLMVHGFQDTCPDAFQHIAQNESPGPSPMTTTAFFSGHGWGTIDLVGYYSAGFNSLGGPESQCTSNVHDTEFDPVTGTRRCTHEGSGTDYNDPILHLGCLMAWYIWQAYTSKGQAVDILAHSMGGLVVRAAIGLSGQAPGSRNYQADFPSGPLNVMRVVTVATPHAGLDGEYAVLGQQYFPSTENSDMTAGSSFMGTIGSVQRPQGANGTWWGLMGASQACDTVETTPPSCYAIQNLYTADFPFPDGDGVVQSTSTMSADADFKILYGEVEKTPGVPTYPPGPVTFVAALDTQYTHEADSCLTFGITICEPPPFYLNDATTTSTMAWVCSSGCTNGFADLHVDTPGTPVSAPRSLTELIQLLPAPSVPAPVPGNVGHAQHAGDDYPYETLGQFERQNEGTDAWNEFYGQCDSFVAWKVYENLGGHQSPGIVPTPGFRPSDAGISPVNQATWSNADGWRTAARELGYVADGTPMPGAVAYWNHQGGDGPGQGIGSVGHVAYVTDVYSDGSITIEMYNMQLNGEYTKVHMPQGGSYTDYNALNGASFTVPWPDDFLHIADGRQLDSNGKPLPPQPAPSGVLRPYSASAHVVGPTSPSGQFSLGNVWYTQPRHGEIGDEQWTHTNGATAVSTATWAPAGLLANTCYRVDAFVPDNYSDNPVAVYTVHDQGGTSLAAVNENAYTNNWAELGVFETNSSGAGLSVTLDDRGTTQLYVAADAMRFWRQTSCARRDAAPMLAWSPKSGWTLDPGHGFTGNEYWSHTTGSPTVQGPTAGWAPSTLLPGACYEVSAYVPDNYSDNDAARYHVQDQHFVDFWPQVEENAFTNQFASLGVFQAYGDGTLPVTLTSIGPANEYVAADEIAYTLDPGCAGLGTPYNPFHQAAVIVGPGSDPASFTTGNVWYSGIGHGYARHDLWTHTNGTTPVSTATWTTTLPANTCYNVSAWIPANFFANNTAAHYEVTVMNGSSGAGGPAHVNQAQVGDAWAGLMQIYTQTGAVTVTLDDTGPAGTYTAADAIRFSPC